MKIALSAWLAMAAWVQAAGLDFKEITREINAPADAKIVTADFDFTNNTDKPVAVAKYDSSCSCMSVKIKGGKLRYAPGESGVVRAQFDMGNFSGEVDKVVALWIDNDPPEKPSISLTVRVHIPVLVSTDPKTLKWEVDGKPDPKTIQIRMNYEKPIRVVGVSSSTEAFKFELKTIEEGKSYDLIVTPDNIKSPGLGIMRIETDCELEKHRLQQVFAVVSKSRSPETAAKP